MSGYFAALSAADVLVELAERNPDVVLLTQDFGAIGAFTARFPERHFDLGISEANLVLRRRATGTVLRVANGAPLRTTRRRELRACG